ncbi:hypothetical protein GJAV_G00221790 [Gymnothorax javanicus]|nr:hypothetical protein GJAV_G00221790 [Gymnothorax javanicus]
MNEEANPPKCMTEHPGFLVNCLNVCVLGNIQNIYQADYGRLQWRTQEERLRYFAYRCFVSWCWEHLGRTIRVVIPSCVVNQIRQEFPDPQGRYVGFRRHPD